MDEETPVPKGESQLHYETLLEMAKELCPTWKPARFIRDGAPQISNAVEKAFPGVEQVSCYFHFKQALDRWLSSSPAAKHLDSLKLDIQECFTVLHFASDVEELQAGLDLLRVHVPDAALWRFLETSKRLPGQAQSNWWFAGSGHGTPTTACALEASNRIIKSYGNPRGITSMKNSTLAVCGFVLDTDTRLTFKNDKGVPRILESYVINERKVRAKDWTLGMGLAGFLETTCALTTDGVITHWALLDDLPIQYAELVAMSEKRHTSWAAWNRWQAVRLFSTSSCQCPQHQKNDFCKHVAAAQAHHHRMRAPPEDVISSLVWNRIMVKRCNVEELNVLRMLRNVARSESRAESKRLRSVPPPAQRLGSVPKARADSRADSPPPVAPLECVTNMTLADRIKSLSRRNATGPCLQ